MKKEIEKHLRIALEEIGDLKPTYNRKFKVWIFRHAAYPDVEYAGSSKEEVIKNYRHYLHDFIKHRLNNNIDKKTKERGGKR